jgi:hypothetical protein
MLQYDGAGSERRRRCCICRTVIHDDDIRKPVPQIPHARPDDRRFVECRNDYPGQRFDFGISCRRSRPIV